MLKSLGMVDASSDVCVPGYQLSMSNIPFARVTASVIDHPLLNVHSLLDGHSLLDNCSLSDS